MLVADYNQLSMHRLMLRDVPRTQAFRAAIKAAVRPEDVVLDVGSGSGILSLFAAQAGAARVWAVERSPICRVAERLAAANGLAEVVRVIESDLEDVELPEQVDVIVSEWLGCYGIDESFLHPVLIARDRWLKDDGLMLPNRVAAWVAPVSDRILEGELGFFRSNPYGLDLSPVAVLSANEAYLGRTYLTSADLLADPAEMWTTECSTLQPDAARTPFEAEVSMTARQGRFTAFAAWFVAEFPYGTVLTNSPAAAQTHWGQAIFPLTSPQSVEAGQRIDLAFACIPADPGFAHNRWELSVDGVLVEEHDTASDPTLPPAGHLA
jgi:SAM-dependent methyltransferase